MNQVVILTSSNLSRKLMTPRFFLVSGQIFFILEVFAFLGYLSNSINLNILASLKTLYFTYDYIFWLRNYNWILLLNFKLIQLYRVFPLSLKKAVNYPNQTFSTLHL